MYNNKTSPVIAQFPIREGEERRAERRKERREKEKLWKLLKNMKTKCH